MFITIVSVIPIGFRVYGCVEERLNPSSGDWKFIIIKVKGWVSEETRISTTKTNSHGQLL